MEPGWLHTTAIISIIVGFFCALTIIADEFRHPQKMWIMNLVWPLTALFGSVLWLWFYFSHGRATIKKKQSFRVMVAKAASHCGSGCTLGDICAEWLAFAIPAIAVTLGWHSLFQHKLFAVWILDYIFAYGFGIIFQYFTIAPMRKLGFAKGLWAAVKADTLSLTAWQIGMYGFMALASLLIFPQFFSTELKVNTFEFWFTMQIAMLCGFVTAYPVNWWLLKAGYKEMM